jgi:methoxymalonate biosynthesis acyl carrier protein
MAVNTENVTAAIHEWLRKNVTGGRDVPDDYPLIESGLLTSLQVVELVLFLEERFGVSVDDEEVSEEHFRSIRAIAGLVAGKTA